MKIKTPKNFKNFDYSQQNHRLAPENEPDDSIG